MTQLFSKSALKMPKQPIRHDQRRRRIPTGAPRLVESSIERTARLSAEAWAQQLESIDRSAQARMELLQHRGGRDFLGCPWARLEPCTDACRCRGLGQVSIAFLRVHYSQLAANIAELVKPAGRVS